MYIINGTIGGGTDIVTAVIDSSGVDIVLGGAYLSFPTERDALNSAPKPDDHYAVAKELEKNFLSIQSFLEKRHLEQNISTPEFKYIFVDASSDKASNWIINRIEVLNRTPQASSYAIIDTSPQFQINATRIKNNAMIARLHADLVVTLEDILEGRLIEKLESFVDSPLDADLYQSWLSLINSDFPF